MFGLLDFYLENLIKTKMNQSVIQSISWSLVTLNDSAVIDNVGWPIFQWLANLINFILDFMPVIILITFFWLCYWFFTGRFVDKKKNKDKSLENK